MHRHRNEQRGRAGRVGLLLALVAGAIIGVTSSSPTSARSSVTAPNTAGADRDETYPILYATGDCAGKGSSQEQIRWRVRNVDSVAHTVELWFDGKRTMSGIRVAANSEHAGVFNAGYGEWDRQFFARFADSGKESVRMAIRPKRCIDRYVPDKFAAGVASMRANGPAGWAGLECRYGEMYLKWRIYNTDTSAARQMSVDIYSDRRGTQNAVRIATPIANKRIEPGKFWESSAPFPYGAKTFHNGYSGPLLIRGWLRFDGGEFEATNGRLGKDPGVLHSRTFYDSMPKCTKQRAPWAPTNLTSRLQRDGSLQLSWTHDGANEFVVYRNNVPLFTVGGSPAVIPNPREGTQFWQVRARNAPDRQSAKTRPLAVTI